MRQLRSVDVYEHLSAKKVYSTSECEQFFVCTHSQTCKSYVLSLHAYMCICKHPCVHVCKHMRACTGTGRQFHPKFAHTRACINSGPHAGPPTYTQAPMRVHLHAFTPPWCTHACLPIAHAGLHTHIPAHAGTKTCTAKRRWPCTISSSRRATKCRHVDQHSSEVSA